MTGLKYQLNLPKNEPGRIRVRLQKSRVGARNEASEVGEKEELQVMANRKPGDNGIPDDKHAVTLTMRGLKFQFHEYNVICPKMLRVPVPAIQSRC